MRRGGGARGKGIRGGERVYGSVFGFSQGSKQAKLESWRDTGIFCWKNKRGKGRCWEKVKTKRRVRRNEDGSRIIQETHSERECGESKRVRSRTETETGRKSKTTRDDARDTDEECVPHPSRFHIRRTRRTRRDSTGRYDLVPPRKLINRGGEREIHNNSFVNLFRADTAKE